jgi:hypothetical protein
VRELEKAAPGILAAQGVYVRRADAKAALMEIGQGIEKTIRSELRKRWKALRGAETIDGFDAEVSEGLAAALRGLCESGFMEPLVLEGAA